MAPQLTDEWLKLEEALGGRSCLKGTIEEIIEQYDQLAAAIGAQLPPPDEDVETRDQTVDGVPIRIYKPKGVAEKLPVGVYTHGGGWACGNLDSEDPLCRAIAKLTPCILVSVDYRLSPKYKMPVMIDDAIKAYKWAWHNVDSYGGDQKKFFSIGGSAGGNLALLLAHKIVGREEVRDHIQGCVALVPVTVHPDNVPSQFQSQYKAYVENGTDAPVIDASSMKTFFEAAEVDPKSAEHLPLLSPHLAKFPPTYIAVCGADPLRDDGVIMEKALSAEGVKTKIDSYPKLPHYFWIMPGFQEGQKFVMNVLAGINFVLNA